MSVISKLKSLYCNETVCKLILVFNALMWGMSYIVIKDVIQKISVGLLLAFRFLVGALFLYLLTYKKINKNSTKENIKLGVVLGLFGFGGYLTQNICIMFTTPGKNAFLTGTYSVMVPFVAWAIGLGKPERYNVIGAFVALFGLGFVALDNGFPLNIGDILTLVCALFYSMQIVEVSKRGGNSDVATVTFWEFIVMGTGSLIWAQLKETPPALSTFTASDYWALAFICIVCSVITIATSNHAFSYVDPTAGGLLSSLESPFGVIFSLIFGYEVLTGRLLIGFALILIGVLFSEAGPSIISWFYKKRGFEEQLETSLDAIEAEEENALELASESE